MNYCLMGLNRLSPALSIFLFFITLPAYSSERAHEHGVGSLSIAVEGNEVEIELVVPGADVVGFEHPPSSETERQAVMMGAKTLRDYSGIVILSPKAGCRVEGVEISSGLMKNRESDHKAEHKDEHKHDHKAEHKDEHKHDHKVEHKDEHKEVHAEFVAHYHFHCDHPEKLTGAKVGFFKLFSRARELKAKWITPAGQGAAELTGDSPSLKF